MILPTRPSAYVHHLRQEIWLPRPLKDVFAFFERPENLATITPSSMGFTLLTPSPVPMHTGSEIDYRIRIAGVRLRWKTVITRYEPPHLFVDEQASGPYRYWRHTHTFSEESGGTRVGDHVEYALPGGVFGLIPRVLWVRSQLNGIFEFRRRVLEKTFGAPSI